jgi:hypothetical protein
MKKIFKYGILRIFIISLFVLKNMVACSYDANDAYVPNVSVNEITQERTDATDIEVRGNTTGNIANMGFAAQSGEWVYFINSIYYALTGNGEERTYFMKTHIDGGECFEIYVMVGEVRDLNVVGDWIYFNRLHLREENKAESGIYRMRTDGTGLQRLPTETISNYNVSVVGEWIYYREVLRDIRVSKINRMHRESMAIEQVVTSNATLIDSFHVIDGWVYYGEVDAAMAPINNPAGWWIHRIRPDGTEGSRISTYGVDYRWEGSTFFDVVDDWVYYKDPATNFLHRMRLDGTEHQVIIDHSAGWHNIFNGWIYYSTYNPPPLGSGLNRIKTDGSQMERVSDGSARPISVVHDWIYSRTVCDTRMMLFPSMRVRMNGTNREILQ